MSSLNNGVLIQQEGGGQKGGSTGTRTRALGLGSWLLSDQKCWDSPECAGPCVSETRHIFRAWDGRGLKTMQYLKVTTPYTTEINKVGKQQRPTCSTRKYIKYVVIMYSGKESEKEYTYYINTYICTYVHLYVYIWYMCTYVCVCKQIHMYICVCVC